MQCGSTMDSPVSTQKKVSPSYCSKYQKYYQDRYSKNKDQVQR